jgi:hypothetical protein
LQENSTQIKLEVVGEFYGKEIITSRRTLLERNCKFLGDQLCDKETISCKRVNRISNLSKGLSAFFIVVFAFEKMFP